MRTLATTGHDRFNGLQLIEAPTPEPGPGQVTIDVAYSGIGLIDALWTTGAMPCAPGFVPGIEASGHVRAIGPDVTGLSVGQPVAAIVAGGGGFAEVATTPAALTLPLPQSVGLDLGSVIPINTVTAYLGLTTAGRLAQQERVLVHAGAGGVGSQFGQVARVLGASEVDAVVGSPSKADAARALGYDHVFQRDALPEIPSDHYDVVVDPVGGPATASGFASLRSGGRLLRIGNASQAPGVSLDGLAHWLENKTTAGFIVGHWIATRPTDTAHALSWALDAFARGDVRVELTGTTAPEQADALLERLEQGGTVGKLAIDWTPQHAPRA